MSALETNLPENRNQNPAGGAAAVAGAPQAVLQSSTGTDQLCSS